MDEEQQQFEVQRAHNSRSQFKPYLHRQIVNTCKSIEDQLVVQQLHRSMHTFTSLCEAQFNDQQKGLIFPLKLKKNQEQDLQRFMQEVQGNLRSERKNIFRTILSESDQKQFIIYPINFTEVREIVLQMYIFLEQNPNFKVVVFLCNQVTDLCAQNFYCFEKGLRDKKFIAIVPTFDTFDSDTQQVTNKNYQNYHLTLYKPKDLFCRFVYECLISQSVKAYLPEQIIGLITDMDYYSISYRESCRRFVYCLERSLMLCKKERKWVDFDNVINLIEFIIHRKFKHYNGYKNNKEKILKVIFVQNEGFTIPQKYLQLELQMQGTMIQIDEDVWLKGLRESLLKQFKKQPKYQNFAKILQDKQEQAATVRHKKSRADQLGIDSKKNLTQKHRLQIQITKIIKQATANVRIQGSQVKWSDIKYELRIKPEIPHLITKALEEHEQTRDLVEEITETFSCPLSKYLAMYPKNIGKAIYLIKCLENSGLIDIPKRNVRPIVYNNYFEKAIFCGNHH